MNTTSKTIQTVARADAQLQAHVHGLNNGAGIVYFSHSILSSSVMWQAQIDFLVARGWQVVCADTRGHGGSSTTSADASMQTLVDDTVAVLDALELEKVHYVGLSLGGMSGFGLGLQHPQRLHSLCLCDARADAPPDVAKPWDERIAIAQQQGCAALADATLERWFGQPFLAAHPDTKALLRSAAVSTSVNGFVACARAIQGLDYLAQVDRISVPCSMVVGAADGVLPDAMRALARRIPGSTLDIIAEAGHLPNVQQPEAFNAALLKHLAAYQG